MKAKDAMHKGVEWRSPNTPLMELAQLMKKEDIGAIPIGENDRLVGMVTDRDIVTRGLTSGKDINRLTARDVMSPGIVFCTADESIEDAVHLMEQKEIRRLPVLSKEKRMIGMLSLGDISHFAPQTLSGELVHMVAKHH